jgi:ribose/xylose/arabinose/galactoside ABC-type transport system permease subunit
MNPNRIKVLIVDNGIVLALVVAVVFFGVKNSGFLTLGNLQNILLNIAELGLVALPLAFLVMAGSIDLSLGSIASVSAIVSGQIMLSSGSTIAGIGAGLAFGALAGAINGALVSYGGLNPIVITLGFLAVWGGVALYLTGGASLYGFPQAFIDLGTFSIGPVQMQVALLALTVIASWFVLNRMPLGRQVLAIGGNERVAFLMGIPVKRVRFSLHVVAGVFAALAGVLLAAKLQASPPTVGQGMELKALTVVLLGGVAFAGGIGRIGGVVAGLLFFGVLQNGLIIVGVSQFLQSVTIGLALVVAVILDGSVRKVLTSSWSEAAATMTADYGEQESRERDGASNP